MKTAAWRGHSTGDVRKPLTSQVKVNALASINNNIIRKKDESQVKFDETAVFNIVVKRRISACFHDDYTLLLPIVKTCHFCNKELTIGRSIGRRDVCPSCGADLHCCLSCKHYDRSVSKQCREPAAEPVKEKARANFCDFFSFSERTSSDGSPEAVERTRKALDDLFKK